MSYLRYRKADAGDLDVIQKQSSSIGAPAALRGYRLQHLYTLHRLFFAQPDGIRIQLEGSEDLDLYDVTGNLLEAVQVKALEDDNVTASTLFSDGGASFFERTLHRLKASPNSKNRIVSFGPFGPTLAGAFGSSAKARAATEVYLRSKGFTDADLPALFDAIVLEVASESTLEREVLGLLSQMITTGDIRTTFLFLGGWLFRAMEDRKRIERADVIEAITSIGRLVSEATARHAEWFTTIVPIEDSVAVSDVVALREEFYRAGVSKLEHINASLDVIRPNLLDAMGEAFGENPVVVVHGASGQGKTTLALRYLTDRVPGLWRFQIRQLDDAAHAYRVALALAGHARALGIPVIAYVDVRPRDLNWTKLVDALASAPGVRVLVTVREEDWQRSVIDGTAIDCAEIELKFQETDARNLFDALLRAEVSIGAVDFEEAWARFGGSGPLMEFTFLLTQTESLRDRLVRQIDRLREDTRRGFVDRCEIELLRRVSVAAAYGARLVLARVATELDLPDVNATLRLFEREYLVRRTDDGHCLEGLHAIRSDLLTSLLCDEEVIASWSTTAAACLPAIHSKDVRAFLLHSFSRRQSELSPVLNAIRSYVPEDWIAAAGVLEALLWLGIAEFVELAMPLIDEVKDSFGDVWKLMSFDPSEVSTRFADLRIDWSTFCGFMDSDGIDRIRAFSDRAERLSKAVVRDRACDWLCTRRLSRCPASIEEWRSAATVAFWIGYWSIDAEQAMYLDLNDAERAIAELPITAASELYFALTFSREPAVASALARVETQLLERFRDETNTVWIEDDQSTSRAHYILDVRKASKAGDAHAETMYRIDQLRKIVTRNGYGAQGYGHMVGWSWESDDTTKTSIPLRSFPPHWATELNGMFSQLAELRFRPRSWQQHSLDVMAWRSAAIAGLNSLRECVDVFLCKRAATPFNEDLAAAISNAEQALTIRNTLPFSAVDEWGRAGEGTARREQDEAVSRASVERHRPYLDALRDYQSSLLAFFKQILLPLAWSYRLRSGDKSQVLQQMKDAGVRNNYARMPTHSLAEALSKLVVFQREFSQKLARFVDADGLVTTEAAEQDALNALWPLWYQFAMHPRWTCRDAQKEAESLVVSNLQNHRVKLKHRFRKLSRTDLRVRILSESVLWEDDRTLWLSCDANDVARTWAGLPQIVEAILPILKYNTGLDSLREWVLNMSWPRVNIVPLVRGRLLQPLVWSLRTLTLNEFSVSDKEQQWRAIPHALSPRLVAELGVPTWGIPSDRELGIARQIAGRAVWLAYHGRALKDLPLKDSRGTQIARRYAVQLASEVSDALSLLKESLERIATTFDAEAASSGGWETLVAERPFIAAALSEIGKLSKRLSAPCVDDEPSSTFIEVATRLGGAELFIAELLLLEDALARKASS